MTTLEIPFNPGDIIEYRSSRYGIATMTISKVKYIWTKYGNKLSFVGVPKYPEGNYRGWASSVSVSDLKNIRLIKKANS